MSHLRAFVLCIGSQVSKKEGGRKALSHDFQSAPCFFEDKALFTGAPFQQQLA